MIHRIDERLIDFNDAITSRIIEWLDLPLTVEHTEEFQTILPNDPREILVDKNKNNQFEECSYIQVFPSKQSFTPNTSILDAVMCTGPLARNLLLPTK